MRWNLSDGQIPVPMGQEVGRLCVRGGFGLEQVELQHNFRGQVLQSRINENFRGQVLQSRINE